MNPLADINNLCFVDTETRAFPGTPPSDANVKSAGTYRYVKNSFPIITTWAIGNQPTFECSLHDGFDYNLPPIPPALVEFCKRVEQREAWFAAWNAGFDRNVINAEGFLPIRLEADMTIDVMAQAVASNLAPSLEGASRGIGRGGKHPDGKYLIEMFCGPDGATPQERPAEWATFVEYGIQDTDELREVFKATRPLPYEEWEDYWVSERINERGVAIDLAFVEKCAAIAEASRRRDNRLLNLWTNGQITAVTQSQRIAEWVYDRLEFTEAQNLLVSEFDEEAEGDNDLKVGKLSLARDRIASVLAFFDDLSKTEELAPVDRLIIDVLTTRRYGGSSSPGKYAKMLDQHDGGKLKGMYVFNGAQQTGRFSSKGVQTHNLMRASLGADEIAAIEMINELEI